MSILFKGNLEEGNYTLIKTTDGWVLKGKTSYVGFNFADRPQGEWLYKDDDVFAGEYACSNCNRRAEVGLYGQWILSNYCPHCGARMKGADDE